MKLLTLMSLMSFMTLMNFNFIGTHWDASGYLNRQNATKRNQIYVRHIKTNTFQIPQIPARQTPKKMTKLN